MSKRGRVFEEFTPEKRTRYPPTSEGKEEKEEKGEKIEYGELEPEEYINLLREEDAKLQAELHELRREHRREQREIERIQEEINLRRAIEESLVQEELAKLFSSRR